VPVWKSADSSAWLRPGTGAGVTRRTRLLQHLSRTQGLLQLGFQPGRLSDRTQSTAGGIMGRWVAAGAAHGCMQAQRQRHACAMTDLQFVQLGA
jgi:hypothetical protein